MSERLELDLELPLDRFVLRLVWSTDERALAVFGPSGSGKTSLLEAIAGLRPRTRGVLRVGDRTWLDTGRRVCLPPESRGVGYVPQDARLFPHRDVLGNVTFGRSRARSGRGAHLDPERVLEVLELRGREEAPVASLSGGERQRVALARALCAGPELLLLDEPLAGVDLPLRRRILPYLVRVEREFGVPSIVVTHDASEARLLSRETIVLVEGREAARGRPDDLFLGREMLTRFGIAEHVNVLRGRVASLSGATVEVELGRGASITVPGEGLAPGQEAALLLRAEDLIVAIEPPSGLSAQNRLSGTVSAVVEGADEPVVAVTVYVPRAGATLVAAVTPQACRQLGLATGRPAFLVFKTHACRALPVGGVTPERSAARDDRITGGGG
jgi:molybdate transport system ATP-binding protein